jgi:hypothetical protein
MKICEVTVINREIGVKYTRIIHIVDGIWTLARTGAFDSSVLRFGSKKYAQPVYSQHENLNYVRVK